MSRLLLAILLLAGRAAAGPVMSADVPVQDDTGESSLHTAADGTTYLTYAGPGRAGPERALWLSTLAPGATVWSAPRVVVSTPRLMENWADFASLTVGTDGQLWAQWFQNHPGEDAHGYSGWFARSRDGGATWSEPAPLGHEFVSLAPLSGGRVLAVWLESTRVRDPHAPRPPKDPDAPYAPAMRLKSRLLGPDGATLQDWVVDPDVCTCCQTTLAPLGHDRVFLAYRGHTRDEVRDNLHTVFQRHDWGRPRLLHRDGWKIPACPVNGPAADARGEQVTVAWFTAAEGVARVQAKLSRDGGLTFGPALPIDLGRPIGRVDVAKLGDGSALVSWLEAATEANAAGIYVRRIFPDGALSAPLLVAATSAVRASGFPRLASRREGDGTDVLVSWTDAVPRDPADPRSPAVTRVRLARISAGALPPAATAIRGDAPVRPRAVVRGDELALLEICAPAEPGRESPASHP